MGSSSMPSAATQSKSGRNAVAPKQPRAPSASKAAPDASDARIAPTYLLLHATLWRLAASASSRAFSTTSESTTTSLSATAPEATTFAATSASAVELATVAIAAKDAAPTSPLSAT